MYADGLEIATVWLYHTEVFGLQKSEPASVHVRQRHICKMQYDV